MQRNSSFGNAKFCGQFSICKLAHFFDDGVNAWVVPVALTFLSGKGKHHFEGNLGALLGSIPNEPLPILIDLGYRFQRPGSGNIFRAKVGTTGFGISLGHTF